MIAHKKIIEVYTSHEKSDPYEKLRECAANKLITYKEHQAGKGSCYITLNDIKIRIADHENTSKRFSIPQYNIVKREISMQEVQEIDAKLNYPIWCKQKIFALHVNCTVPMLKKNLPEDFYEDIIESEFYPNTYTKVIKVKKALNYLSKLGFNDRIPVRQEIYSNENYYGI